MPFSNSRNLRSLIRAPVFNQLVSGGRYRSPFKSFKPFNRRIHSGPIGLHSGLYSYRFDSETVRSSGCALTIIGRNE